MMIVCPSSVHGDGLFASQKIRKHTLFDVTFEDHVPTPISEYEELAFYVPDDIDSQALCVWDGQLTLWEFVKNKSHPTNKTPRHVAVPKDSILMKANDLAWTNHCSAEEYEHAAMCFNHMEFILEFESCMLCGIKALAFRTIQPGEEIGITYGYPYWKD